MALEPAVPGCPYDDYESPARTGADDVPRAVPQGLRLPPSEGYVCADPRQPPWNGVIVDDDQAQLVCIQLPDYNDGGGYATSADAAVCQATGPTVPAIDAEPRRPRRGRAVTGVSTRRGT